MKKWWVERLRLLKERAKGTQVMVLARKKSFVSVLASNEKRANENKNSGHVMATTTGVTE